MQSREVKTCPLRAAPACKTPTQPAQSPETAPRCATFASRPRRGSSSLHETNAPQAACGASRAHNLVTTQSEFDPQGLVGPLEAEVRPLDLALGLAVLPEHETLDVVQPKIRAQALERPRRVLDDALAVLFEAVVGERVGVALEVRPDRLVGAIRLPLPWRMRMIGSFRTTMPFPSNGERHCRLK